MKINEIKKQYRELAIDKPSYIDEMYKIHQVLFDYADTLGETDISSIEIGEGFIIFTCKPLNIKFALEKADKRIAPVEILNFQAYEKAESEAVFKLIKPHFNVFDIGANAGWYSLNIAKRFKDVNVCSFEPIVPTYNILKKNIEINKLDNISAYNFGFSNSEQDLKFYLNPETSGNASAANLSEGNQVQEMSCSVRRLDDFITEQDIEVDFIKCDVEGAELFVYQGGIETLKHYKPIVFTEMLRKWSAKFEYHPNDIIKLMNKLGYKCFTVQSEGLTKFATMDESTVETNFFFLHSEKHLDEINQIVS